MKHELSNLTKLLGAENEQKVKDSIVELILERTKYDLDEWCKYGYVINFEELFQEIEERVVENVKEKMIALYTKKMEEKMEELFSK